MNVMSFMKLHLTKTWSVCPPHVNIKVQAFLQSNNKERKDKGKKEVGKKR
jgi:hypothetical protein